VHSRKSRDVRQIVQGRELEPTPTPRDGLEAVRHDRYVLFNLVLKDAELRLSISLKILVTIKMIRRDVEQHSYASPEEIYVFELKA
jgi:hypothetical protein